MQDELDKDVEAFVSRITGIAEVKTTSRCIASMIRRAKVGFERYNKTMDRTDLLREDWLTHLIEELEDARQYAERLKPVGYKTWILDTRTGKTHIQESGEIAEDAHCFQWEDGNWSRDCNRPENGAVSYDTCDGAHRYLAVASTNPQFDFYEWNHHYDIPAIFSNELTLRKCGLVGGDADRR